MKQGELQKVILMLCEYSTPSFSKPCLSTDYVPVTGLGARTAAMRDIVLALKDFVWWGNNP